MKGMLIAFFLLTLQSNSNAANDFANGPSRNREIKGTVKDSVGVLPGVSIHVKGKPSLGTTTDQNGRFILDIPDGNDVVLVFRMVGFEPMEVAVADKKEINVTLKAESQALGEVVVVAFGKQKKSDVIGAVSSINPGDLKIPASNLTTALAGRISGVIAYQRSGEPGNDNADFFIRGVTTFGYKKDPLILIDGIEVSGTDLARLQPDDIASFSIMKDATATSLYGARGANGVILITTKEGKEGKMSISVRAENSLSMATKNISLADPITYMNLGNEAVLTRKRSGDLPYTQSKIDNTIAGVNRYVYPATDWQNEVLKDYTLNQRVNLNASGGGKVARYYLAGTFNQDNGNLNVDKKSNFNTNIDLKSYGLRSNVNINLTPTTEAIVRLSGNFDDYNGPMGAGVDANGPISGGAQVYWQVMHSNPVLFPAYFVPDEANSHINHIAFGNAENGQYINPYANLMRGYKDYSSSKMDAQFEVKQDLNVLTKGLALRALFNTSRYSYFDVTRAYRPFYYTYGSYDRRSDTYTLAPLNESTGTDYLDYSEGGKIVRSSVYLETALNYSRIFGEKHDVSSMLVMITRNSLAGNAGNLQASLPFRNAGLSGRFTYSYNSRYSAEFNFGYNGSERFYETNRFGFFPSAGVAWNISNESFWKPLAATVNKLKFRATYGLVGNDAIGSEQDRFFYLSNVQMNDPAYASVFGMDNTSYRSGISVSRYANQDITWEKAKKTNIGFEMGLFNKLNIEADYFKEHRTNILMTRASIPSTMGLSASPRANVGVAKGQGIDGSIDYTEFINNDFWVKSRANFTYAASEFIVYEEPNYSQEYLKRAGKPLSQNWGYIAERLFVDDKEAANSPRQPFGEYGGGDIKYHDVNGDGRITELDRVPLGFPTDPEIIYGFGLSTGFKRFDFSFFFQGSARSSFWIDPVATSPFVNETQLLTAYANDYWSEDNRNIYALWPRLSSTLNSNNTQVSSWFMRNGSFLRLKSLELGYSLPKTTLDRLRISNARFYLNGLNLMSFSKFKLWDVEMGGNGLGYPIQKTFNLGALISF